MNLETQDGYKLISVVELHEIKKLARQILANEKSFHIYNRQVNSINKTARNILAIK
jgi:hypothetical protein